jgi:hypothetical protein|nr:MAG TPA: hypothetical protein [Bacteriophage sp.]
MIILRKYPEEEQKEFSGRRNLAAKVIKSMRKHLRKSEELGKKASNLEIHSEKLKQEATNLMENKNYRVLDYNPFSEKGSQALATKDGIRDGRYLRMDLNNKETAKFIDEVDYAGSKGQIMVPGKTKETGIEDILHEGGHIDNRYEFPSNIISSIANRSRNSFENTSPYSSLVTGGILKNIGEFFTRPIKTKAITADETKASKRAMKSLKKLKGVTEQDIKTAEKKYKTAKEAYKEKGKAYRKEPLKEILVKISPSRKKK